MTDAKSSVQNMYLFVLLSAEASKKEANVVFYLNNACHLRCIHLAVVRIK
jgi:hypothetical protein